MSEYADIKLVECNRQQSIQGTSGNNTNPAHFTCRLGNTISLKAGDTVEVLNAFVSEDGCGGQNIELKGESIKDGFGKPITQDFEYTRLLVDYWADNNYYVLNKPLGRMNKFVLNSENQKANQKITKEIKDNEINVEQSYYISANGENYFSFPRQWLWEDSSTFFQSNLIQDYENEDGYVEGASAVPVNPQVPSGLNGGAPLKESLVALCDYFLARQGGNMGTPASVEGDQTLFYKPIIDNERYTCFCRAETITNLNDVRYNTLFNEQCFALNPLLFDFVEYKELKTLTLPVGYISPNAVAERITEQLQRVYEYDEENKKEFIQPQVFSSYDGWDTGNGFTQMPLAWTPTAGFNLLTPTLQTYSTETYKPFEGWDPQSSNIGTWEQMVGVLTNANMRYDMATQIASNSSVDDIYIINTWFQQAQWIYVKRPEIFMAGRKINTAMGTSNLLPTTQFQVITNAIANNQTIGSTGADPIRDSYETNYEWTTSNLENFRDLFIEQNRYYKCLIEDKIGNNTLTDIGKAVFSDMYDEARFLHASRIDNGTDSTYGRLGGDTAGNPYLYPISGLGNDGYRGESQAYLSTPVFFAYQSSNATKLTTGENPEDLCYGAMFKKKVGDKYYIVFRNDLIKWLDFNLFDNIGGGDPKIMSADVRCIGWDWHARSYGNVVLGGTSGYLTQNTTGDFLYGKNSNIPSKDVVPATVPPSPENSLNIFERRFSSVAQYSTLRYVGANNPSLDFDPVSQTFGWKSLHTAENTGQADLAGSEHTQTIDHPPIAPTDGHGGRAGYTTSTTTGIPMNQQAGNEVYKINKRLRHNCYCPDARPYGLTISHMLTQVNTASTRVVDAFDTNIIPPNRNMKLGTVFDSHCGIYLNFGKSCPQEYWDRSLIGILGFTWEQYNPTIINQDNNRLSRITNNNIFKLDLATTNSQIVSTELKQYPMNIWGGITYSTQVPQPMAVPLNSGDVAVALIAEYRPAIVEQTESIVLRSQGVPKLMSRPYFTIRTDLLDSSEYTGGLSGGLKMPIIGIVDKMSGEGDYYFTEAGGMSFTISRDRNISSITTSIHDPNGEMARVDLSSAVIYKISRMKNTSRFNIVQQILEEDNAKK